MQTNSKTLVVDTSCLILLNKLDCLHLLKVISGEVLITPEVKVEFGKAIPDWIKERSCSDKKYMQLLELEVDRGEASVMALSMEKSDSVLIIDDLKARNLAEELKINYSGSMGVLLRAKRIGAIDEITPIIDRVRSTDFRISEQMLTTILKLAGEA